MQNRIIVDLENAEKRRGSSEEVWRKAKVEHRVRSWPEHSTACEVSDRGVFRQG